MSAPDDIEYNYSQEYAAVFHYDTDDYTEADAATDARDRVQQSREDELVIVPGNTYTGIIDHRTDTPQHEVILTFRAKRTGSSGHGLLSELGDVFPASHDIVSGRVDEFVETRPVERYSP